VDVVINPKKTLRTADFSALMAEVTRAFEVIARSLAQKRDSQTTAKD
jgi:hypothetical protein